MVDPSTQDLYSLNHFVGAYEVIRQAVPGREVRYGTRGGLSKHIRAAVKGEAVGIFRWAQPREQRRAANKRLRDVFDPAAPTQWRKVDL